MKKTLVSALTTALVVGAASTTFAAANPFADVPADHWAYDAVAQLASDGVVNGYPADGQFKGDATMTRYEMAQIVAKAMAKADSTYANKAMLDKLAAEFADELANLGVRVAALENKVDNVKWNGLIRYEYKQISGDDKDKTDSNFWVFTYSDILLFVNSFFNNYIDTCSYTISFKIRKIVIKIKFFFLI